MDRRGVYGGDSEQIALYVHCGQRQGDVCLASGGDGYDMAWLRIYRAAVVLRDDADPARWVGPKRPEWLPQ